MVGFNAASASTTFSSEPINFPNNSNHSQPNITSQQNFAIPTSSANGSIFAGKNDTFISKTVNGTIISNGTSSTVIDQRKVNAATDTNGKSGLQVNDNGDSAAPHYSAVEKSRCSFTSSFGSPPKMVVSNGRVPHQPVSILRNGGNNITHQIHGQQNGGSECNGHGEELQLQQTSDGKQQTVTFKQQQQPQIETSVKTHSYSYQPELRQNHTVNGLRTVGTNEVLLPFNKQQNSNGGLHIHSSQPLYAPQQPRVNGFNSGITFPKIMNGSHHLHQQKQQNGGLLNGVGMNGGLGSDGGGDSFNTEFSSSSSTSSSQKPPPNGGFPPQSQHFPHFNPTIPSSSTIATVTPWNHNISSVKMVRANGNAGGKGGKARNHHRSTSAGVATHQRLGPPLKLVVIGSGGVGKSAITIQFVQQYFIVDYDPTIADTYQKNMFLDGELVRLEIYDTAGQDEFATMRDQSLREADGFLLVFSVTNRESLEYVCRLQRFIEVFKDRDSFPMILVGNKCDLEVHRQIGKLEAEQLASSWDVPYIECSAKSHRTITEIFEKLVKLVRQFQFKDRNCNGSVPWINGIGASNVTLDKPDGALNKAIIKAKKKRKNCPIQ